VYTRRQTLFRRLIAGDRVESRIHFAALAGTRFLAHSGLSGLLNFSPGAIISTDFWGQCHDTNTQRS